MEKHLRDQLATTAFAFRGYNVTNLGRSDELLADPDYGPVVERHLREASEICAGIAGRPVDLVRRVRQRQETDLDTYAEAVTLIVAMEMAQIALLEEVHQVPYGEARLAFGYSLGELVALAAGDAYDMDQALIIPLSMAKDCAELAWNVRLGILFSRGPMINYDDVTRLCLHINYEGQGIIGVSAILSPNTLLLMGQARTIYRFKETMHDLLPQFVSLKINPNRWPPLHTPIMWERSIPNRAAVMLHRLQGGFSVPEPPVLSLVTGTTSYNDFNIRETLHRWVDHPQRLWDAVYQVMAAGIETVVHVGPEPNLIPATFRRLSDNVQQQITGRTLRSLGARAVSSLAGRQWLSAVLPSRTALLRAPRIRHFILEDWLLENAPSKKAAAVEGDGAEGQARESESIAEVDAGEERPGEPGDYSSDFSSRSGSS